MNESMPNLRKVFLKCLREAGTILQRGFKTRHTIQFKTPISIVTEVDKAADRKIISLIRQHFPSHHILTEESTPFKGSSPYRWIVDPLDGTTNYAHGIGICAVSIGLEQNGIIIMGGIYNPFTNELFLAEKGKGATLNGKRIQVSRSNKLLHSVVATGFPYDVRDKIGFYLKFVEGVIRKTRGLRRLGAAALDLSYVACGRFDAFWEFNLQPWDIAAGILIVEEAGGKVTGLLGQTFNLNQPSQMLSSNSFLHKQMISIFKPLLISHGDRSAP